eukprot:Phypoly_transcript_02124.p1 GENE.Phypoly_transcript_02124~~Phypoly_transcript_02124.p1  ORF type:complete len:957 (+),score=96.30 Phypoly_transcript_02124:103-2871(+)
MDKLYPTSRIQFMISEANIRFVVVDQACPEDLLRFFNEFSAPSPFCFVMHPDFWIHLSEVPANISQAKVYAGDACYICFTSGSTGRPKGVILPHRGAINFMFAAASILGFQLPISDHFEPPVSLTGCTNGAITFDLSIADIFFPLTMGGKVFVVGSSRLTNVESFVNSMCQAQVSIVWMTPSVLRLLTENFALPPSLTDIVSFGEPMPATLARKLMTPNRRVWNWYGPTECSILSTCFLCTEENISERVDVPIGKPLPNYTVYLFDSQLNEVPSGEVGHLFLGGPGVMLGYTNSEATSRALFNHPTCKHSIYKTGDLARFQEDGNLQYVGRVDRQIKLNGIRMELGEIENTLMSHPWVQQAIVRVGYSSTGNETKKTAIENQQAFLVAYLLLNSDISATTDELFRTMRAYLSESLPSNMIPSRFLKLDKLPINSHGKLDLNLLPPIFGDQQIPAERHKTEPNNQAEELLLDILSPLFQFPLTPNTNILELQERQNALSSISQNAHLTKALYDFGITIPQTAIYQHKTIKNLAEFITNSSINKKISLPSSISPLPMQPIATHENVELCIRTCFENALNIQPVGREDNFFMLGGTSFSAVKLTFLLWKQTGVEISFPLLVQHPTVHQIASYILSQIKTTDSVPVHANEAPTSIKTRENVHITCLQEPKRAQDPKLFLVHPAFWSSVSYLELSSHFPGICGVYGIEGNPGPHSSDMQSLAATYVQAVFDIQPIGPYYIAGYSFGAAVAFEMGHQMICKGKQIGRVGLIAPPLWPYNVSPIREFRLMIAVLRRFFDNSDFHIPLKTQENTNIEEWFDIVAKQMHKFLPFDAARNYLQQMYNDAHTSETLMVHYQPTTIMDSNIFQMYLPASEYAPFLQKIRNMWSKLCPNIQEFSASGDHSNIVYEHHAKLLADLMHSNFFSDEKG